MKRILAIGLLLTAFCFGHAYTATITSVNNTFSPDSLVITVGDTVIFQLDTANNAQEVGADTWNANDSLPVTGFQTLKGGGMVTGLSTGIHYYVNSANAAMGMKGKIIVMPRATIRFTTTSSIQSESVDSILVVAEINNPGPRAVSFTIYVDTFASSAKDSLDYLYRPRTFTHTPGIWFDTTYLVVLDEQLIEPTEMAILKFRNVSSNATVADSVFTHSIMNDDTLTVEFLGAGLSYQEKDTVINIAVIISSPVPNATSITVILEAGNAIRGVSFDCQDTTTLTFAANSNDTLYIPVQIMEDTLGNGNVQANFTLIEPTNGARLGVSAYTLFIIDNDNTSSIYGVEQNSLKLFPNPAGNKLNVYTETEMQNVVIVDLLGNRAQVVPYIGAGNNSIDVSGLAPGSYVLVASGAKGMFNTRFIKVQ